MTNEAPAGTPETTPTTPVAPVAPKKGASRIVTPILALVAVLVIGLFAGILIGHNTATPSANGRAGFTQGEGFPGGSNGGSGAFPGGGTQGAPGAGTGGTGGAVFGRGTSGKIVSIDGSSIVVKANSGTQVTVTTTSSTRVTKSTVSTSGNTTTTKTTTTKVSALKVGETITVIGQTSGSTVAATFITEGAGTGFGGFRPGGTGGGGNN